MHFNAFLMRVFVSILISFLCRKVLTYECYSFVSETRSKICNDIASFKQFARFQKAVNFKKLIFFGVMDDAFNHVFSAFSFLCLIQSIEF